MVYFKLTLSTNFETVKDQTDFPKRVLPYISGYDLGSRLRILCAHIYIDHTALGNQS